jgi:hypothetical protein
MILSPAIRIQVHAAIKAGATLVSAWARGIATLPSACRLMHFLAHFTRLFFHNCDGGTQLLSR